MALRWERIGYTYNIRLVNPEELDVGKYEKLLNSFIEASKKTPTPAGDSIVSELNDLLKRKELTCTDSSRDGYGGLNRWCGTGGAYINAIPDAEALWSFLFNETPPTLFMEPSLSINVNLWNQFYFNASQAFSDITEDNPIVKKEPVMQDEIFALNTILYGPPGTGKTYSTKKESERIINSNYEKAFGNQIEFVTFHPSYSYEDFVEGIRPVIKEDNQGAQFEYHCGIFKEICLKAFKSFYAEFDWNMLQTEEYKKVVNEVKDIADKYVLIIDEINRGDISKIFGELITLIEPDKRFACENSLVVRLPYTKQLFAIPPNLYILGTMNTADRSLALIDIALRRRFDFVEMKPDFSLVPDFLSHHTRVAEKLNDILGRDPDIGKDKKIGHAFFFNTDGNIRNVWIKKIWPLLEEYYYFDRNKLVEISGGAYTIENGWNEENIESFLAKYR